MTEENITPEETRRRDPATASHDQGVPPAYAAFMRTGWGDRELDLPPHPVTPWAAARRERLADLLPGERLVVPAGTFKVRANDTDYRFRPQTAHTHLSRQPDQRRGARASRTARPSLYARPRSSRDTDEFFRDRVYGELWAGRRPSLHEMSASLGLECRHIDDLPGALRGHGQDPGAARGRQPRRRPRAAPTQAATTSWRPCCPSCGWSRTSGRSASCRRPATSPTLGFEDSVREWDRVARARRALDRGHVLPPRPRDGQRHRLRLDRRRRPARHHAALDRQHRPGHARRAAAARHGRRGDHASTPPTSPARSR